MNNSQLVVVTDSRAAHHRLQVAARTCKTEKEFRSVFYGLFPRDTPKQHVMRAAAMRHAIESTKSDNSTHFRQHDFVRNSHAKPDNQHSFIKYAQRVIATVWPNGAATAHKANPNGATRNPPSCPTHLKPRKRDVSTIVAHYRQLNRDADTISGKGGHMPFVNHQQANENLKKHTPPLSFRNQLHTRRRAVISAIVLFLALTSAMTYQAPLSSQRSLTPLAYEAVKAAFALVRPIFGLSRGQVESSGHLTSEHDENPPALTTPPDQTQRIRSPDELRQIRLYYKSQKQRLQNEPRANNTRRGRRGHRNRTQSNRRSSSTNAVHHLTEHLQQLRLSDS